MKGRFRYQDYEGTFSAVRRAVQAESRHNDINSRPVYRLIADPGPAWMKRWAIIGSVRTVFSEI